MLLRVYIYIIIYILYIYILYIWNVDEYRRSQLKCLVRQLPPERAKDTVSHRRLRCVEGLSTDAETRPPFGNWGPGGYVMVKKSTLEWKIMEDSLSMIFQHVSGTFTFGFESPPGSNWRPVYISCPDFHWNIKMQFSWEQLKCKALNGSLRHQQGCNRKSLSSQGSRKKICVELLADGAVRLVLWCRSWKYIYIYIYIHCPCTVCPCMSMFIRFQSVS